MCRMKNRFTILFFSFLLLLNDHAVAQTLTLYTYPPAHAYRWESPHRLLVSTLNNYIFRSKHKHGRLIGHMIIELKKDADVLYTAMSVTQLTDFRQSLMREKLGLGVLFKTEAGVMEQSANLQAELAYRTQHSTAAFIRFTISDSAYRYLRLYIDSFRIKGYDKFYNGANQPRAGGGAGCTAFGLSFLELINALQPEFADEWAVKVPVPESLIGDTATGKKVSVWRIFFSRHWAVNNQPKRWYVVYEPYYIYRWINSTWDAANKKANGKYQLLKNGHAKGLQVDCRDCLPVYPMFQK